MLNPSLFLAEPGQFQGKDLAIRVFLFLLIAVILFVAGYVGQLNGKAKPWVKYLGLLPIIGLGFFGKPYFDYASNSFNQAAAAIGGSAKTVYQAVFVIPVVLAPLFIVVCILIDRNQKRRNAEY